MKHAVRRAAQAFATADHADKGLCLVVVRGNVVVGDRPVPSQPVAVIRLEVVIREPERHPPIVVRPAAYDSRAEPPEVVRVLRDRIRLAVQLPSAARRREESERLAPAEVAGAAFLGAAMVVVVRPLVLLVLPVGVEHRARFEQRHTNAETSEHVCHGRAAGARSDDDDVVDLRTSLRVGHRHRDSRAQRASTSPRPNLSPLRRRRSRARPQSGPPHAASTGHFPE